MDVPRAPTPRVEDRTVEVEVGGEQIGFESAYRNVLPPRAAEDVELVEWKTHEHFRAWGNLTLRRAKVDPSAPVPDDVAYALRREGARRGCAAIAIHVAMEGACDGHAMAVASVGYAAQCYVPDRP